eukprot:gene17561-biopygen21887
MRKRTRPARGRAPDAHPAVLLPAPQAAPSCIPRRRRRAARPAGRREGAARVQKNAGKMEESGGKMTEKTSSRGKVEESGGKWRTRGGKMTEKQALAQRVGQMGGR